MNYSERNIDHKIGKSIIWAERIIPRENDDVYLIRLYRKEHGEYTENYPTYISDNLLERSRNEKAEILNNLRNYHE